MVTFTSMLALCTYVRVRVLHNQTDEVGNYKKRRFLSEKVDMCV